MLAGEVAYFAKEVGVSVRRTGAREEGANTRFLVGRRCRLVMNHGRRGRGRLRLKSTSHLTMLVRRGWSRLWMDARQASFVW